MYYRSVAAVLSTLTLAALVPAAPAGAEPATCQGRAVTTQGDTGTDGDDVMVVGPGQKSVSTGAGNDVVCIRLTADDPVRRYLYLDTGPGDDVVHNETTSGRRDVTVLLSGDTTDMERDVIDSGDGNDYVATGSEALGAANPDVVATGTGDDRVEWAGQQVGGSLDLGAGDNRLSLVEGWVGDVAIDAPSGTVTAGGSAVLRWSGAVGDYELTFPNLRTTFTGTDADERVTYWPEVSTDDGSSSVPSDPDRRLDVDLAGGDDRLDLSDSAGGSMIGGPGRDMLHGGGWCAVAEVRLGSTYDCEVRRRGTVTYSSTIDVWEKSVVLADELDVVGSNGPDVIKVGGRTRIRLDGRGGADVLTTIGSGGAGRNPRPAVVRGGGGDDELRGGHLADRLVGGPGHDLVRGNGGDDVVLGGAGRDRLFGGKDDDTLLGGTGRDRADGQKGRDGCVAEVRRSCERR
ncbi:calcium-binding protein [Nocardioides sp. STR2]|uniref:Calcium-binding protein n=1 Tax=Nocardioides pini TaxID=2975053 RepID=A0ABT4CIW4_9ACTN|nr:calcium-binding protein [Nocardioides pini]MCY4728914.1 calcium-binding protein [Nocardioides pini]